MQNRRNRIKALLLTCGALLTVTACTTTNAPPPEQMTFDTLQPFPLYVASYEIQNQTGPMLGFADESVDAGFVASVNKTVDDYLHHRFSAVGTNGKFLAVLKEASVKSSVQPSDNKIGAWLEVDKRDRFDMKVVVHMAVFGIGNYEKKGVDVIANRMLTVPEHVTLAERERLQMEALDNLIDDLDASIQQVLKEDFQVLR